MPPARAPRRVPLLPRLRLRRASTGAALATLLVVGAGCFGDHRDAQAQAAEVVLVRIGETPIRVGAFLSAARVRADADEFPRSGSGFERFRDRLLQELIIEEVLLDEAQRRELAVTEGDLSSTMSDITAGIVASGPSMGEGETELAEILASRFGDSNAHRELVRRRLMVSRAETKLRDELTKGITVTDEQVEAAKSRFAAHLMVPARLHSRQIFLQNDEDARSARRRLVEGEDFATLAQEYNGTDGDMGWVAETAMPPMLATAVRGLPVGRASEIVRSPLGYHLFMVLGRRPAGPLPDDQARAEVVRRLMGEAIEARLRGWIAARSDELKVTVEEEAVGRLRCCRAGLPYWGGLAEESG